MNKKNVAIIAGICTAVVAVIVTVICIAGSKKDPFKGLPVQGIAAGAYHTSVLYDDGTVLTIGGQDALLADESAQWTDAAAIAAGDNFTAVLLDNGFVQTTSAFQGNTTFWRNIVEIAAGTNHVVGLCDDGRVLAAGDGQHTEKYAVESWTDIVAVAAGDKYTAGLQADGTVVIAGQLSADVSGWKNITAIAGGYSHLVGLDKNGKVFVAGGANSDYINVNWKGVKAIAAGKELTVAIKENGKVLAAGADNGGRIAVDGWSDCIAVSCGLYHTVGVTTNSTLLSTTITTDDPNISKGQDAVDTLQ